MAKKLKGPEERKPSKGNGVAKPLGKSALKRALGKRLSEPERIESVATISIPKMVQAAKEIGVELGLDNIPDDFAIDLMEIFVHVKPEDRYQIFELMIQRHLELATENGNGLSKKETPALPGCCMRNAKGSRRSTDLDPQTSPDPEQTLEMGKRMEIARVYREHADDAGSDPDATGCCPRCAQRTATPTADEYANVLTDKQAVEGRRSIELDPESLKTPEEQLIKKQELD